MAKIRDIPPRAGLRLATFLLLATTSSSAAAEQVSYNASYVKAVYLKKLLAFVEWPKPVTSYTVCILGDDLVGTALAALAAENEAALLSKKVTLQDSLSGCQVLFIGDSQEKLLDLALSKVAKSPILTISDVKDSLDKGGMIEFIDVNNTVKIGVNRLSGQHASLKFSTQLLEVAHKVIDHVPSP